MQQSIKCILLVLFSITLTSCASLFTGTSDNITINSEPEGATILVEGIDYGSTPATISVKRPGLSDKQITLQLDGYEDRVFTLQKEFNVVSIINLGNILAWGIDIGTGAVMKYNPRNYNMELKPEESTYNIENLSQDIYGHYLLPSADHSNERLVITDQETGLTFVFEK